MPAGDMYQAWANATPTMPFPFTYSDKKVGKVQQTWADVRNGIQRDAVSTALPFCTGHFTPSLMQANIISNAIKKENTFFKVWTEREESVRRSHSSLSAQSPNVTVGSMERDRVSASTPSSLRTQMRSALEQDALLNSEGGRGRLAYLKIRNRINPQDRYGGRLRTTSQTYGWNVEIPGSSAANHAEEYSSLPSPTQQSQSTSPHPPTTSPQPAAAQHAGVAALSAALEKERSLPLGQGVATGLMVRSKSRPLDGDYRRKCTLNDGLRASGVFPKHK